ncbi:AraC family transcriptional regulator [Caballeronia udeis]|uniref:AraC family transcriptional regulator n=1 Tax=Caballeronia udeis TaxID=1232866 RepID=A0A168GXJ9_9BURK|nr:AraC family transcriptional regulator [Caballeronia udeis]
MRHLVTTPTTTPTPKRPRNQRPLRAVTAAPPAPRTPRGRGNERGTIAGDLVEEALRCAEGRGVERTGLLALAGIQPAALAAPLARVSAAQYGRLWSAVADALDDEFFGQDSHPMRRGSFALLCHAALGSRDGAQALNRIAGFLRLVLDDLQCKIDIDPTRVRIRLADTGTETRSPRPMFVYATAFIMIYGLLCWLVGRRIPVLAAHLRCPEPAASDEYRLMFCDAMFFDQPASYVDLAPDCVTLPVVQTAATLKVFLREAPANFIVKYRNPDSLAARIRRKLRQSPPVDWPDSEAIAAALNMAEATLRRRLKQEGATYQSIRDALRRDLAIARLADTTQTIAEIAHALGFAEPSAFHRAFRKWTGVRPAAYRGMRTGVDPDA